MRDLTWPSFSIVVPTFNRRELVCDVLHAIDLIEYPGDHEVIVVIDGSRDGTREAILGLALGKAPLVLYHENNGPGFTRNRGAQRATGDIILFLDDDMICRSDILVAHAREYQAGADAVLGDIPLDPASPPSFLSAAVGNWAQERSKLIRHSGVPGTVDLLGGHISVRRSVFKAVGGFDDRFTEGGRYGNEDLDFGVRLLERFDVRFSTQAVSWQRYIVTPWQNLRQCFDAGQTDVIFAAKHPHLEQEVFAPHKPESARVRYLIQPLAAVPGLHRFVGGVVCMTAALVPRSGRLTSCFSIIFHHARELTYWAGVRLGRKTSHNKC